MSKIYSLLVVARAQKQYKVKLEDKEYQYVNLEWSEKA